MSHLNRPAMETMERWLLLAAATDDQIVYAVIQGGQSQIYVANSNGSNPKLIPIVAPYPINPAFRPDRTGIAFTSVDANNQRDIWTIDLDGGHEKRLTNNNTNDSDPRFNPAGDRIVFVAYRDGDQEIYSMDLNGENVVRLTNDPGFDTYPSFSPDGSKIIFTSNRAIGNRIYVMDAATGENVTPMTNGDGYVINAVFSPEGRRIAFSSNRTGQQNIWIMDARGEAGGAIPERLTAALPGQQHSQASFSPDGTKIAYYFAETGFSQVRVIDATTGLESASFPNPSSAPDWSSLPRSTGIWHGVVTVVGTGGPDSIALGADGLNHTFTVNGKTEQYPATNVTGVQVFCGGGNDLLDGTNAPLGFYGSGDAGDDKLLGGVGNDTLTAGAGKNTLFGGDGNDRLNGSSGRDFLYGDAGNDRLYGNAGNDYMVGGSGVDRLWGGLGDDLLSGNSGNDKMFGEDGNDQLLGGDGNDLCYGGLNVDTLNGGKGIDASDGDDADLLIQVETVG